MSVRTVTLECAICYCHDKPFTITKCNHLFCKECLKTWLSQSVQCPSCRMQIKQPKLSGNELLIKEFIQLLHK